MKPSWSVVHERSQRSSDPRDRNFPPMLWQTDWNASNWLAELADSGYEYQMERSRSGKEDFAPQIPMATGCCIVERGSTAAHDVQCESYLRRSADRCP